MHPTMAGLLDQEMFGLDFRAEMSHDPRTNTKILETRTSLTLIVYMDGLG